MLSRKDVLKGHDNLKSDRAVEELTWRALLRLFRPDDADFSSTGPAAARAKTELFDSTPLYALDNFVGGTYGMMINPANRWLEFGVLEDPDLAQFRPVKAYLWAAANRVYGSVAPGFSQFYAQAQTWIANMAAIGFGALYQEERIGYSELIDRAIATGEIYLAVDAAGNLTRVDREFSLTGEQLKGWFGAAVPATCREDARYQVVHAVMQNPDVRPGALGPAGMPWWSTYCSPDLDGFETRGGYFELPYHVPMWNGRARSAYPTGPGHNAKADAQMLQAMEQTHLAAGQWAAEPALLVATEDVLSAADLEPNAILYGALTESGKRLVDTLDRKAQLQLTMAQSEQRRDAIRKAFYFSVMQVIQRPQMTATEFLGYQEEGLKLMAPNLVRFQIGGLSPFVRRRWRLLERAGQMPPVPPELAQKHLTVEFVSPLAKVQKLASARGVLQLQQSIEQMALTDPAVRDNFDADVAARAIQDAFTSVPGIIRDPRAVEDLRRARADALAQQAQLEQMGQAVSIAAEASHAMQAGSLAQQRSGR